jgi:four helix bundle protein
MTQNIKNLDVYKRAHALALDVYKITESFPKSEMFGLVSQMRRAAVSINSNLCEGGARNGNAEFKQFIGIAQGSAAELEYQCMLAGDLGFVEADKATKLADEIYQVLKMLIGLSKTITVG